MSTAVVGSSVSRKDGALKVMGQARYAADHPLQNVAHAVAICSTIGNGRVSHIDSSAAERAPGFLAIIHHGNAPQLFRPVNNFESASKPGEIRVVFEDDRVRYAGQCVAVVVAETLQQVQRTAELVQVTYETRPPAIDIDQALDTLYDPAEFFGEKLAATRDDPESAFQQAEVTHEANYLTPIEHYNPMESSASIAHWDVDELTLYETTQQVVGARNTVAETMGMPEENVHMVSPFIGGGFGCKGFIWPHSVMSAIAAKKVGRPVKLNLTRKQTFSGCGHRSETRQKVSLGASRDGKLSAIKPETLLQTSASARRLKRMESRCDGMAVCAWISSKRLVPMSSSRTRRIVQRPPTTAGDRAIGHTLSPIESICRIALWRLKRSASSPKPPVDATIHVSNRFPILTGWRTTTVIALGKGLSATQAGC